MHPRITNTHLGTFDDCRVSFESTDALELDNEHSGDAVHRLTILPSQNSSTARPDRYFNHFREGVMMKSLTDGKFTAFIGIDWADAKHDICLQPADKEQRE